MVVRRDLHFAGIQLPHWMVAAVMSEFQLVGFPAQRNAGELMSQANPENRLAAHQPTDVVHGIGTRLGITRPIRQEHAIGLQRQHVFRSSLRRNDRNLAALAAQFAQNVLFDPIIVGDNIEPRGLVFHAYYLNGLV